jgi:peptide deformylase
MAVLRIAKMGNPVLGRVAAPVADPTAPQIRLLADDMRDTLEDIGASGLAAPQVFENVRVVVYRVIASRIPKNSGLEPRPWTEGRSVSHDARSSWAALLQHECDHLDGIVYPMRMTDLALLAYNEEPGPLAREVAADPGGIDPLFIDLVERWPARARWFGS